MEILIKPINVDIETAFFVASDIINKYPNTPLNKYELLIVKGVDKVKYAHICRTKTKYIVKVTC